MSARRISFLRVGLLLACLVFGVFAIVESLRISDLMADVEPADLLPMTVTAAYDANKDGLYRDYRLVGRLPDDSRTITVKASADLVKTLGPGFAVGVYRTYRPDQPYVTQASYENARPFWRLGGFIVNWFAALGAAFIAMAGWVLACKRSYLRVGNAQTQPAPADAATRGEHRFAAMIRRLEAQSRSNPDLYKSRLFGLAFLGYGFLTAVLAAVLAAAAALVYFMFAGHAAVAAKLLIPVAVLIYAIVRALWVTLPPPDGLALTPDRAPGLFAFLGELRRKARGPRIHRVLLNEEMNASIVQVPRLGVFGWHRNYLVLGLPMLQALSPEQMKAVIAHEFGHLAGAHGKFSTWVYRIRKTWAQLADQIAARSQWSAFLFRAFFGWYVPYFNAYSFVLARAYEYDADRLSAAIAGAEHAAAALVGVEMKAQRLSEKFWTEFERQIERMPEPPVPPHAAMAHFFASADSAGAPADLDVLLKRETGLADTHPSLADRLKALGIAPRAAEPIARSAAADFFGPALPELVQQMDEHWRGWAMPRWQERHANAAAARDQFLSLKEKAQQAALEPAEQREFAKLVERFESDEAALPIYRDLLSRLPGDPVGSFFLGRLLLRGGDDEGIGLIDIAMTADVEAVLPGCELVYGYLHARGRIEEAARYRERWIERNDLLERDRSERAGLADSDRLKRHGLGPEAVAEIVAQLRNWSAVRRAYLAEKDVTACPERPLLILAVDTAVWPPRRSAPSDLEARLAQELRLPNEALLITLDRRRALRRKLKAVPDSLIYES